VGRLCVFGFLVLGFLSAYNSWFGELLVLRARARSGVGGAWSVSIRNCPIDFKGGHRV